MHSDKERRHLSLTLKNDCLDYKNGTSAKLKLTLFQKVREKYKVQRKTQTDKGGNSDSSKKNEAGVEYAVVR